MFPFPDLFAGQIRFLEEPPEKSHHADQNRGEQGRPRPRIFLLSGSLTVHDLARSQSNLVVPVQIDGDYMILYYPAS